MQDDTQPPPFHDDAAPAVTDPARDPGSGHPRPPRREFKARGSFVRRCAGCNLPALNCLCPYRLETQSRARVWLLTHPLEHHKPTNTGRLIRDVLPDTEVFTWYRTAPDARLLALLDDARYAPFVIFPDDHEDYAHRVVGMDAVAERQGEDRIPVFIILDGTWRQARRIFRKSPYLAELPVLPLATERLTRYRLRKPASAAHLCTAEVAVELLRQSGDTQAAGLLDDYFDAFNDSYAASRRHEKLETPSAAMRRLLARRGDAQR
ncbi:tRNA-uridine aminocarboxypropyltransferase [Halomonas nitroreducens]|uniref:tRNA-uridine aminocarboxypropyltransferase n=1 Tax=Halomonas nitroreducens TaxID=447425 RepID=A0A3S0HRQ3_9GAMM|nr:DTW domain-containing protein [Halomonas nitroreducens]RTR02017.1 DTW domain-containing protein [Halomonas nitroreducens]